MPDIKDIMCQAISLEDIAAFSTRQHIAKETLAALNIIKAASELGLDINRLVEVMAELARPARSDGR